MPGKDGLTLVRALNQHEATQGRQIVTIAAAGLSVQHRQLALEARFAACMNKPLEPARLIDYIVTATNRVASATN